MKLTGTLLMFRIDKRTSLAPLCSRGYSAPTKEQRACKVYGDFKAEIDRKIMPEGDFDRVFINVTGTDTDTIFGQTEIMADLASAGLLQE